MNRFIPLALAVVLGSACGSEEDSESPVATGGTGGGGASCTAGTTPCGTSCVDLTTSATDCGTCGHACAIGQACSSGACACLPGTRDCGAGCVDTGSDAANCGTCGTACDAGLVCSVGVCAADCAGGLMQCGSSCVDLQTSSTNCGTCAVACGLGQTCTAGSCTCPSGQTWCGDRCTDLTTDSANCGACGAACTGGSTCGPSGCVAPATGGTGGTTGGTGGTTTGGTSTGGVPGSCSSPEIRITEIDVGATVVQNEDEAGLIPLAISPIPSGGSRVAWMGNDGQVHVTTLDASDQVTGSSFGIEANDFGDIYADDTGGVLLLTRDAQGGGTLNCGNPSNLCGTPPNPAIPCYDMYLVRFDGSTETWATKLTTSSASLPPYSTSATGPEVFMIWWYAHHGRIASDGTNWSAFYGAAISVSEGGCINIHQGDEMRIVNPSGAITGGFDWGCSHSGYERVVWDDRSSEFVTMCQNDAQTSGKSGRLAFSGWPVTTIYPVDLWYSNVGNIVLAGGGGYWTVTSDIRDGQAAASDGLADVHLLHFTDGAPDQNLIIASDAGLNDRAPHLASYGASNLLAAWETSSSEGQLSSWTSDRTLYVQVRDATTGAQVSAPIAVDVEGNRYYEFRSFPDGSVAYPAPGSSSSTIKILRVLPCSG